MIKSVKEQLRAVPAHGSHYGVLRYLNDKQEIRERLSGVPTPEAVFLYLGRFEHGLTGDFLGAPDAESTGLERSELSQRGHLLEITAVVAQDRLRVMWRYSTEKHERETIERLADEFIDALAELIEHCCGKTTQAFTPSDFPAARLSQSMLDKLTGKLKK